LPVHHLLGIRHHGVGSAKNVVAMLEKIRPDLIFVEGPPEMEPLMAWAGQKDLQPPVAALCYDMVAPQEAAFYPFAEFSPEWQAACFANKNNIPLRLMDLPIALSWELRKLPGANDLIASVQELAVPQRKYADPIHYFAEISGYTDADLWWEHHFEQKFRADSPEAHFEAVLTMMHTLRESGVESVLDEENRYREAWMANLIRQAQRELYSNIAVICGAWHAPALLDLKKTEKEHARIVRDLPKSKIKVGITWVPWTNERLSFDSGYGAGLVSPGWYAHLWKYPLDTGAQWLTAVAHMFRRQKMDVSTAHVIESVRLAETLAILRALSRPGLQELQEATQTVMCMGDAVLLDLVRKELVVGFSVGKVPDDIPKIPLQADFEENCRKLKLVIGVESNHKLPDASKVLDLRKASDLERSIFLHRLLILHIPWATQTEARTQGTFKEVWELEWRPEVIIVLIEKGVWGNTVEAAAQQYLLHRAQRSVSVSALAQMMVDTLPSELFDALPPLLSRIHDVAALSAEIMDLMAAVAALSKTGRYGNVRQTDLSAINTLLKGFITRICVGLPGTCRSLDGEAAQQMFLNIRLMQEAVRLLEEPSSEAEWLKVLVQLSELSGIHPLIAGCATRLLFDVQQLRPDKAAMRFSFALSAGQDADWSAAWIEGFLKSSGMVLLYDETLWNLLFEWVEQLPDDTFKNLLPILRRTFAKFEPAERRKLGEKAKRGIVIGADTETPGQYTAVFDTALADLPMELLTSLLRNG